MNTATNETLEFAMNGNTAIAAFSEEAMDDFKKSIDLTFWGDLRPLARGTMSAILHLLDGREEIGDGVLLKDKEMIRAIPAKGNLGYVLGSHLSSRFPNYQLRGGDLNNAGVYRLTWDGFFVIAREVVYQNYEVGEGESQKHDRAALRLFNGTQVLHAAFANGYRVKFAWSGNPREGEKDYMPLVEYVDKIFGFFKAGDSDSMEEARDLGMAKARLWSATGQVYRAMAKGQALKVKEMLIHAGGKLKINKELIGKTVQVFRGSIPMKYVTFTTDNYQQAAGGIARGNFTVIVQ